MALPRGGVGGGIVPAGGLDFAKAFATALGRPLLRVVVVTVLPHSACIIFCHFFVLIQKWSDFCLFMRMIGIEEVGAVLIVAGASIIRRDSPPLLNAEN